jgi:hypothetical protein
MENSLRENVFSDKSAKPDEQSVLKALGTSGKYWLGIRKYAEESFGPLTEEWKYYSPKYGWTMKLLSKKRNLLFFVAMDGSFRVAFVFGDKAVAAIEKSDLPKEVIDEIRNAKKYVEGTGLRLEVKDAKSAEIVKRLIQMKVEN